MGDLLGIQKKRDDWTDFKFIEKWMLLIDWHKSSTRSSRRCCHITITSRTSLLKKQRKVHQVLHSDLLGASNHLPLSMHVHNYNQSPIVPVRVAHRWLIVGVLHVRVRVLSFVSMEVTRKISSPRNVIPMMIHTLCTRFRRRSRSHPRRT